MLIYSISYIVLATIVVLLSNKLADYVDLIDKKTNISGAFIGGVILAAVTSLPELFTSISSVTIVKQPSMVIGNILGSNIFNMTILGLMIFFASKRFIKLPIGTSHLKSALFSLVMFGLIFCTIFLNLDFSIFHFSIYSLAIIAIYILSVRFMASDNVDDDSEANSNLTLKQIVIRFVFAAIALVSVSITITFVTDKLASLLKLDATLAGALFLGLATSLPELTSSIALVRKSNFNACVGNIMGSGIFNFLILAISDFIYTKGSVYTGEGQTKSLVLFGTISVSLVIISLLFKRFAKEYNTKNNIISKVLGTLIVACYVLFIVV